MSRGERAARSAAVPSRIDGPADWYRDAIIYEAHVRAFADSNGDGIGDFRGLAQRLDYLADLGITALWLLPFYPSPLRDDGYDIADYRTVHPDYGDLRQFKRFLGAAHDRHIRVITELVVNHTSDQHPWFQRARHAPPGSPERDFYVWSDHPDRYADARVIFQDFEASNWTWDPVAEAYFWHRFYSHQPDLNYDSPDVEGAVMDTLDFWLDMGVDGLRLDAVPYLHEREGTNCENLPETHEVLKRLRKHMDARYPDRMLLAEANQWPEDAASYFGDRDGDECHMNFHFPVMPRLFMSLRLEHRTPIVDIMEQTPEPPPGGQWATFLRNHDELTLEMVTDEERDLMLRAYATDLEMRINLGIRRRLAPLLGNDRRKIELLNALLFSLPGTPVIYYGDEIGMGDNVYLGDRNGVRTPMQWTADRNAGFSTANPHRLYLPLITEQGYHYESVNVETQAANPASLLSWMRQLIALRKRHGVLGRGTIEFLEPENAHVLAFLRHPTEEMGVGDKPLLCVANLSRLAQQVELDLRDFSGAVPVEVFGQNRFSAVTDRPYSLSLSPYGFMWFAMDTGHVGHDAGPPAAAPRLHGTWTEALRRRAWLTRTIGRWLPGRRWFAGKDATVRDVTIDDIVELSDDVALLVVRTSFTEGDDQQYAVPLMRVSEERAVEVDLQKPGALLALTDDGAIVDAMTLPEGAGVVAGAALRRRTRRGRSAVATGHPRRPGLTRLADDPRDVHVLGVEQSNSSVIVGGRVIAKLIRQLSPGENPDVTLPLHLRAMGFDRVPGVAGTLDVAVGSAVASNVVVVHDVIGNEADLWQWGQDLLTRDVERLVTEPESTGDEAVLEAVTKLLGKRTAQMHLNLSGGAPAFEPERFSLLWQRSIVQSLRASVRETQRAVRRNRSTIAADAEPLAVALARARRPAARCVRRAAHTQARRGADPRPRRPPPRAGAVDGARRRVHRLRG